MKRHPSPPAISQVSAVTSELQRLARASRDGYRDAWRDAYSSGSGAEVKTHGHRYAIDGSVPGPTAEIAANKEGLRDALSFASKKLDEALALVRSAHGLILHDTKALKDEGWTAKELASEEARAWDNRRGKSHA